MIAKDSGIGKSFSGIAKYLESGRSGNETDRVAWYDLVNLDAESIEQSADLMTAVANENTRVEKPTYHFSINWHKDESSLVSREMGLEIAREALKDVGLAEHQAMIVAHKDRDHFHIHIVANRIHPDTEKAWDRSFSKIKLENSMARLSLEHGFEIVPGRHNSKEMGLEPPLPDLSQPSEALRYEQRTDSPSFDTRAKLELPEIVDRSDTWEDLHKNLKESGYEIQTRKRGLVFVDEDGHFTKASSVSREFSRKNLENRFETPFTEPGNKPVAPLEKPKGRDLELVIDNSPDGRAARKIDTAMTKLENYDQLVIRTNKLFIERQDVLQRTQGTYEQFQQLEAAKNDVRAAFKESYADPNKAMEEFVNRSKKFGSEFAMQDLAKSPELFGKQAHGTVSRFTGVFVENDSVRAKEALLAAVEPYNKIVVQIDKDPDGYRANLKERFDKKSKADLSWMQKELKKTNRVGVERDFVKAAKDVKIADVSKLPFNSELRGAVAQNRLSELYGQQQDRTFARDSGLDVGADYKRFPSMPGMLTPEDKAAFVSVDKYARAKHAFEANSRWMNEGSPQAQKLFENLQETALNLTKAGPQAEKFFHKFKVDQRELYGVHLKPVAPKRDDAAIQRKQDMLQGKRDRSVKAEKRARANKALHPFAQKKSPNILRSLSSVLRIVGIPVPRIPMPKVPGAATLSKGLSSERPMGRELKRD